MSYSSSNRSQSLYFYDTSSNSFLDNSYKTFSNFYDKIYLGGNMKKEFMAVILGCDENTYGFARVIHEEYRIKPIALTTTLLEVCKYTKIIDIEVDPELHNPNHLINKLINLGEKLKNKYEKLIVIPCSDFYMEVLCKEKEKLNMYENQFIESIIL